jgi:hypothetical protein
LTDRTRALVEEFSDRFSKRKLDIEVTTMYEAELETKPGKKVVQIVRPLRPHKFDFALKAVRQLEAAGVVRESDSPWRSNVVMVPKPMGKMNCMQTLTQIIKQGAKIWHSIIEYV